MEISAILSLGIIGICVIFNIIVTNVIKEWVPKKVRPYVPLITAMPFALFIVYTSGAFGTLALPILVRTLAETCGKIGIYSIVGYDTIVKLFKTSGNDGTNEVSNGNK